MILDTLMGNKRKNRLPEGFADKMLANKFSDFFEKIEDIVENFRNDEPRLCESAISNSVS